MSETHETERPRDIQNPSAAPETQELHRRVRALKVKPNLDLPVRRIGRVHWDDKVGCG